MHVSDPSTLLASHKVRLEVFPRYLHALLLPFLRTVGDLFICLVEELYPVV